MTLEGYRHDLKPVRRYMGGKKLQQVTKADGDGLVEWMLTEGRRSPRHYQPGSLMGRVVELIGQHPEGVSAATINAAFPDQDVHTSLSGLIRPGHVTQPGRALYALASPAEADRAGRAARGVKPVTVRSTLTTFGMVVQSFVDQGTLPRNVIALVERPADTITEDDTDGTGTAKSLTVAEVERFRESVRNDRLFACWLPSCYGRSQFDGDALRVRRGRVAFGTETVEGLPKSRRGRRDLPPPPELAEALRALRTPAEGRGAGGGRRLVRLPADRGA